MVSFAETPGSDEQDSVIVRSTFRLLVQYAILLGVALSALHGLFFWSHGDPIWMLTTGIGVILLPLYPLTGTRRPYPVFFAGLICFLLIAVAGLTTLSLRYGSRADFHLILLAIAPGIMVAGRIELWAKWLLVIAIAGLIFWLDQDPATPLRLADASATMLWQLRASNLLAALLMLSTLMLRYFRVIVRAQRKLMEFAALDPLTGLYNRRHFLGTAAQEVARADRYGGNLCVALADLDRFKGINDRLGHEAGDMVLRHVSQLIRNAARNADCVCRWGGEEFIVLLPETEIDGAMRIAERICTEVSATPVHVADQQLQVTLTLGVAMRNPGEAFDNAVRRADRALYAGKAAGRNRAVLATA